MKRLLLFILTILTLVSTADAKKKVKGPVNLVNTPRDMAIQFAKSELKRFPHLYLYDYGRVPFFGYTQGVGGTSYLYLYRKTGDRRYFQYAEEWCDTLCMDDGTIQKRSMETYNLDLIRGGWVVCEVYNLIKENPGLVGGKEIAEKKLEKYKKCMEMQLIKQLKNHPKTCDGGYWHKLVYPHQMWLDGIYMASPFMAIYGQTFNHPEWQAEALQQVITCWHHTYDARTGLLHHAWDESASQRWSDAEGHSPNFWGRSVGWYLMAIVDILDYIPEGFTSQFNCGRKDTIQISGRDTLISYINQLVDALPQYQRGGLWYQVLDCPDKAGNWPESTVTVQFMYAIAKAVNKGYLPADRIKIAWDAYNGLQQTVFTDCRKVNAEGHVIGDERDPMTYEYGPQHTMVVRLADGTFSLTQCCAVGGLGGNKYRDGSFEYYIGERVRDNDGKGSGIFIMGCWELDDSMEWECGIVPIEELTFK